MGIRHFVLGILFDTPYWTPLYLQPSCGQKFEFFQNSMICLIDLHLEKMCQARFIVLIDDLHPPCIMHKYMDDIHSKSPEGELKLYANSRESSVLVVLYQQNDT